MNESFVTFRLKIQFIKHKCTVEILDDKNAKKIIKIKKPKIRYYEIAMINKSPIRMIFFISWRIPSDRNVK